MNSPYLNTAECASFVRSSTRTIRERTRTRTIPFRQPAGTRGCLFLKDELEAWVNGDYVSLEPKELPGGGVVVRLIQNGNGRHA